MNERKNIFKITGYLLMLVTLTIVTFITPKFLEKEVKAEITSSGYSTTVKYTVEIDGGEFINQITLNGIVDKYFPTPSVSEYEIDLTVREENGTNEIIVDIANGNTYTIDVTWDETAPILNPVTIASSNNITTEAVDGDTITLSITASESIQPPTVTIAGQIATVTGSGDTYAATYDVVNGTTPNGEAKIVIKYSDLAGNEGGDQTTTTDLSTVTISGTGINPDNTPPILDTVTIISDNNNTALAEIGNTITLTIVANEAIQTPTVTIAGQSIIPTGTGTTYTATYTAAKGDPDGVAAINITYADLVGNAGTPVTATKDQSTVTLNIAPTLDTVTIISDNNNTALAEIGNTITLTIIANEDIQTPGVTIAGKAASVTESAGTYTATYTAAKGDPDGVAAINITYADLAGNPGTPVTATKDQSTVTLNIAPELDTVTIISDNNNTALAEIGNTITLTIIANEDIQTPGVTIAGQSIIPTGTGTTYTATYIAAKGDPDGVAAINITYADLAGNQGTPVTTTKDQSTVTLNIVPELTTVTIESDNTNTALAKVGDTITLTIIANEDIQTPGVTIAGNAANVTESAGIYKATYTVVTGDSNGVAGINITYTDLAGNLGTPVTTTNDQSIVTLNVAPILTTTIISDNANPAYAQIGDEITLTITANKNITAPTVTIAGQAAQVSGSGTNYTATYTIAEGDPDGVVQINISNFNDDFANAGQTVTTITTGSVTVDNTIPTVVGASITSDNGNGAFAKVGDTITLSLTFSENLGVDPTVKIAGQPATVSGSENNYTATYQVVAVDSDGLVNIKISGFVDLIGNVGKEVTKITAGSVTIDKIAPVLSQAILQSSNNFDRRAKVGDTLTLSLIFDDDLGVNPTVTIAGEPAIVSGSGNTYMAIYEVQTTTDEGIVKIDVSNLIDVVGNVNQVAIKETTSGDDIIIDKTKPVIETKIVSDNDNPEYAKEGDTITLTIEADETLAITPTVTIAGQSVTVLGSGENYTAKYVVEHTTDEGIVQISISGLKDLASNTIETITTATEGEVTIDTSAPSVSNASIESDNEVKTKAKLGDTITLSLTFDENLETGPIVKIAGQNAKVIGSGTEYTATYEVTEEAIEGDAEISVRGYINNTGFMGKTVTQITSGNVAIDRTIPTLTTKIVSNNSNVEFANLGDVITLTIESSEDLANIPIVTIAGETATVTGNRTNYRATYVVAADSTGGIVDIKISGIIDETGNEGIEVKEITEGSVKIDKSGPILLTIIQSNNATNSGLAKIGDIIMLVIEADEDLLKAPTVTIAGESAVVEGSGSTYTATYEVDEDTTEGNVTISISDYEDKAGNVGLEITSVTTGYVKVDLVNPTILSESETPTKDYELIGDEGIQAYSLDDGETWIVLDTVSSRKIISFSAEQRYEIKIKDVAGNISETKTVGYYRPESILIPDIKIIGPASINIGIGTEYEELGFIAIDGDGTILNDIVEIEDDDLDEDKAGEYVITYSVTNEQGRIKSVNRTVKVVRTTEAITDITLVTLNGSSPLYLDINEEYEELGVTIDESIEQESLRIDGEIDTSKVGIYELTYTVLDKDENTYIAKRAVVVTGKKESKELAIDINEGFQTFTVNLESPLLKLEDTEILYVVSDSEPALDAQWQSTEGQINLSTTEEGTSLYALIRNKSAYEIIKVTELKYYEKIESTNQSKISYKIDGKDYSLTDINENLQNQWIQEKEIMKVYESAEGKAVEFENNEKYDMEKVVVYYEIINETTESTLSLIPIVGAADMSSVELAKGEKLVVEVPNGKVLRYKIETLTTGGDKDISNEYKLSVNQEGKIIINTTLATTKYTTMIITIAIVAAVAGLGVLVYLMTKKSSKI